MGRRGECGKVLRLMAALGVLCAGVGAPGVGAQARLQAYEATEMVVVARPGNQAYPVLGGPWVVWHAGPGEEGRIHGRNLDSGEEFVLPVEGSANWPPDLDGDRLAVVEWDGRSRAGIAIYGLADDSRRVVVDPARRGDGTPLAEGEGITRMWPRLSGDWLVWSEGAAGSVADYDVRARNLRTGEDLAIATGPAQQDWPALDGRYVVWLDGRRSAGSGVQQLDVYAYDLEGRRELRLSTRTDDVVGAPAVSGDTVVWWAQRDGAVRILGYDLVAGREFEVANLGPEPGEVGVDIDGRIVVWSQWKHRYRDHDIHGVDLATGERFVVCQAIGDQRQPRISGERVVWTDARHSDPASRYAFDGDVYGAVLSPGPAAPPVEVGAPSAVDARIEIVWPHGGAPVTEAERANVGFYLLQPGTLRPAPCQWQPEVLLWGATDQEPVRLLATGAWPTRMPMWEFNDVNVRPARDPAHRMFFLVQVTGTPTRYNVWAHAADARTYHPIQVTPTGVLPRETPLGAVDARIEIVWPHGGALVTAASRANVTAILTEPGSLRSVPTTFAAPVRLLRALNNGVSEVVAVGERRLVTQGGVTYPVWDFFNIDVAAARDARNVLYFTLQVDGVETYTNVWAHGADARTYMPAVDVLEGACVLPR